MARRRFRPTREFPLNENRLFDKRRYFHQINPSQPAALISQLRARLFGSLLFVDFYYLERQITKLVLAKNGCRTGDRISAKKQAISLHSPAPKYY